MLDAIDEERAGILLLKSFFDGKRTTRSKVNVLIREIQASKRDVRGKLSRVSVVTLRQFTDPWSKPS
jgi:hypothetical protein